MAFAAWWEHHLHLLQGQGVDIQNFWITSMAFLDDIYFVCRSFDAAQIMLNDLLAAFAEAGLQPNLGKLAWMANKYVEHENELALRVGNVLVPASQNMIILGSYVSLDIHETPAFKHRVGRAWACFHKWEHILCSTAPLAARVRFWSRVVLPSILWGLQTVRGENNEGVSALRFCQNLQLRKMMRLKRKPIGEHTLEPWLDWQIRTLRQAAEIGRHYNVDVSNKFQELRISWAGHVARLGVLSLEPHMAHVVLMWRPIFWWREQQLYSGIFPEEDIKHPVGWGRPRRFEESFQTDWMMESLRDHYA
jgi:hypothetical protein